MVVELAMDQLKKTNAEIRKLIKVSYGCANFTCLKNKDKFFVNTNESILGTKKKYIKKCYFKQRRRNVSVNCGYINKNYTILYHKNRMVIFNENS